MVFPTDIYLLKIKTRLDVLLSCGVLCGVLVENQGLLAGNVVHVGLLSDSVHTGLHDDLAHAGLHGNLGHTGRNSDLFGDGYL